MTAEWIVTPNVPISVDTLVTVESLYVLLALALPGRAVTRHRMTVQRQLTARSVALTRCTVDQSTIQTWTHSNVEITRRPASADRTARAANFRRDLKAT